ncbi:DUF594 family protein [Quillaja saponaria]|nr:DUF594 family protein [Quillaja saponaria]
MELVPPGVRNLWNYWELRVLVLASLTLQMVLIFLGNRRRYASRVWIRIAMWCSYLMADSVATVALGVISNNHGDVDSISKNDPLYPHTELTAFWAPFLLLHLGGPDTITAYSLEDNELWLRHLLSLGVQTGVSLYIVLRAWTGSRLSVLSIFIFCAGFIKYGERTWVLRSASSEQFRDSMLTPPDPGPNYSKFMLEYTLKQLEGFHVIADEVVEAQIPVNLPSVENNAIPDAMELITAYDLLQTFKRLFVDLILGIDDRDNSQSLFKDISFRKACKVVEIELGFIFDMLYTKATVIYSLQGCATRFICLSLTAIVLILFSFADKNKYLNVDVVITFLLLSVAIVLEIYAILLLLSSDWMDLWLSRHTSSSIRRAITCLQLPKNPRWSNFMAQYNLISYCLGEKPAFCYKIQKLLCIDKLLEKHRYKTLEEVTDDLKELIFNHLKEKLEYLQEKSNYDVDHKVLCPFQGSHVLEKYNCGALCWSTDLEFDQSILIWHIATDLCFYADNLTLTNPVRLKCRISMQISRYILYLLVVYPFMLPIGIGMIRFRDTCADTMKFLEERRAIVAKITSQHYKYSFKGLLAQVLDGLSGRKFKLSKDKACDFLLSVNTEVPPSKVKGDRSKSVLFDACRLASELQAISDKDQKWEMVSKVWVEMLAYAASQCRGNYHAQQLRRGGEILTHVWLLMAHFGLTEQFQISEGHARARLNVK